MKAEIACLPGEFDRPGELFQLAPTQRTDQQVSARRVVGIRGGRFCTRAGLPVRLLAESEQDELIRIQMFHRPPPSGDAIVPTLDGGDSSPCPAATRSTTRSGDG